MLGYLQRNFFLAPSSLKRFLYRTLVRSKLECAASIWDPGATYLTDSIESVQNKSAHFILANYNRTASVTSMNDILLLPSLAHCRRITSNCLFHKIFHHDPALRDQLFTRPSFLSARLDHQHKVGVPSCRYNKYFNSFIPRVTKKWNRLPSSLAPIVDCAPLCTNVSNHVFPTI